LFVVIGSTCCVWLRRAAAVQWCLQDNTSRRQQSTVVMSH